MENISLVQKQRTVDPVLLGRPVQVFESIANTLAQQIAQHIQQTGHRRIALTVQEARFSPAATKSTSSAAVPSVTLTRQTVQALMAERYGFTAQPHDISSAGMPMSSTESRITHSVQSAIQNAVTHVLPSAASHTPSSQCWQWQASIQVGELPAQPLCIELHTQASASLEHCVAQQRRPVRTTPASTEPLLIELDAVLAHKKMTAADVQQLRVGSIVSITMERAKVSLNGQAMLSASVAEHQGTLHLTAFENLD